jgi:hypothetical protein
VALLTDFNLTRKTNVKTIEAKASVRQKAKRLFFFIIQESVSFINKGNRARLVAV